MGGSTPSMKAGPVPEAPAPIDYAALMQAASAAAGAQVKAQFKQMIENYPAMERQQLGSVQNIASLLGDGGKMYQWKEVTTGKGKNKKTEWERVEVGEASPNQYTQQARGFLNDAMAQRGLIGSQALKLGGIGDWITAEAQRNYDQSGPTSIESQLYADAESELALGRNLSPEQIREAQQSARTAFAARGLGTSMGSSAAELLNRDAYATARQADRRQFAASANDMQMRNVMARRDQAAQQAALGAGVLGNSAQLAHGAGNLGLAGAQAALAIDPVQRAMSPGLQMGGGIQGTMGQMIQPTYANATTMAGNVAGFNTNMQASMYNSALNNNAAMRAARMQVGAMNNSAMMGLLGSSIQGGIQAGGMIGAAQFAPAMFSDKRMKKDIKPIGKAGSVLGLTAYEYKYKGDDQKRVGFMAQDVQKVLPEAVTEVEYKGKKRLAIKPAVIGAALADELMAAKAA